MGSNEEEISHQSRDAYLKKPVALRSSPHYPQACTFIIPPDIIAEAMSSLHGLDLRWSGPITPTEINYVQQYVQARYPELYAGLIETLKRTASSMEDGETSGDDCSSTCSSSHLEESKRRSSIGALGVSLGEKTELDEKSRLVEMLQKRAASSEASISIPEIHARTRVLKLCSLSEQDYLVVFANGVKEALALVGESYPFLKYTMYMSVLDEGVDCVRQFASYKEAKVIPAPPSWLDLRIAGSQLSQNFRRKSKHSVKGLFAFPAQSSPKGPRNSLHWVSEAQRNHWRVLLDSSDLVLGEDDPLNLTMHRPDFVISTLPKAVGHPTKLTCLLVRKCSVGFMPE